MAIVRRADRLAATRAGAARLRFRISVMLAVSIGLLVMLAVFSVLAIQLWATRENTLGLLNDKATFILNGVEKDIASYLDPVREQVAFIADQIENGPYDIADKARLGALLTGALAPLPQVDRIIVFDPDLQAFIVRRERDGGISILEADRSGYPQAQAARERLRQASGPIWGELVYRNGETYASYQQPLRRGGETIGYLVAAISTTELSQLMDETGALLSTSLDDGSESFLATAFILYGPNKVLAHPNLISDNTLQSVASPAVDIRKTGDLVLASLWDSRAVPGFEKAQADAINVVGLTLGGLDYVFIYRWVDTYGEVPWAIGLWAQASDLDAEIRRLDKAALAGLAVAVLAVFAAIAAGRLLAKPIHALSSNAVKIAEFDLEDIENLPPSRIKELDEEATAFNAMLAGLRSFETYVPRALVARLMRTEGAVVSEQRRLTVMFTDIAGFTTASESQEAEAVASFLNNHFAKLGACIEAEDGTIDKFIGDSLMAFWGAPESQDSTERRACRAALAIAAAMRTENAARVSREKAPVRLRIGIHTGEVVVGNIGAPGRINYTIVGDTVNVCQRIEGLGREIDPDAEVIVLVGKPVADALDGSFTVQSVGDFEVRGRSEPIEVFRLRA